MVIALENQTGSIPLDQPADAVRRFFTENDYTGKRLLVIIPDHTRSGPIGEIFQLIHDAVAAQTRALDVLVALGTHQPMTDKQICQRLALTPEHFIWPILNNKDIPLHPETGGDRREALMVRPPAGQPITEWNNLHWSLGDKF